MAVADVCNRLILSFRLWQRYPPPIASERGLEAGHVMARPRNRAHFWYVGFRTGADLRLQGAV
jgi:hypothetical protein